MPESEYMRESAEGKEMFCGTVTRPQHGVVDTAAESGLVGSPALESQLKGHGLRVLWSPKKSMAKGVGGQAKVLGVVLIPLSIGGANGILEACYQSNSSNSLEFCLTLWKTCSTFLD